MLNMLLSIYYDAKNNRLEINRIISGKSPNIRELINQTKAKSQREISKLFQLSQSENTTYQDVQAARPEIRVMDKLTPGRGKHLCFTAVEKRRKPSWKG